MEQLTQEQFSLIEMFFNAHPTKEEIKEANEKLEEIIERRNSQKKFDK